MYSTLLECLLRLSLHRHICASILKFDTQTECQLLVIPSGPFSNHNPIESKEMMKNQAARVSLDETTYSTGATPNSILFTLRMPGQVKGIRNIRECLKENYIWEASGRICVSLTIASRLPEVVGLSERERTRWLINCGAGIRGIHK